MFKRFASIVLSLIMVLGIFPIGAMAETAVTDIRDRANIQFGEFGSFFEKSISGFGSNGIQGTHIRYIYNVSEDLFVENVIETLSDNTGNKFLGMIESPDPNVYTKVEKIDLDWEDKTSDFIGADGSFDGTLGWFNYVDGNGNLCNVSKTFSITWTNADGTQKYTDNIMLSVVFPQIPSRTSDRTGLAMPEELQEYFEIGSNRIGDYLEYRWNVPESTEESIKTSLAALNGKVSVMMDAPNATYSEIKKISWNGTDHTQDFVGENGNIEFNGQIMVYNYLDEDGNLQNYKRDFEIVWTDSTKTKEFVDKITVALIFFEEDNGGQGGNEGGNQGGQSQIRSEATVTGGTTVPVKENESLDELYEYWNFEDIILKNQIKVTAPGNLAEYLECSYDEYGIITVKLKNNVPASVWKEAYDQLEPNSTHMFVDIEVSAPGNYTEVATFHGNGDYGNLLKQYESDPDKVIFYEFDPENDNVGCGYYIAQIITEEDKITIIPDGSDGIYFSAMIWKNGNEVKKQILVYRYEVEEGTKNESFENLRRPAQNVVFDDRTEGNNPVLKAEYNRYSGYLEYTYIGTKTADSEIAADIIGTTGENTIYTLVMAPEGYRCADGNDTFYVLGVSIDSPDSAIVGRTISEEVKWVNDDGDTITESITIEFDPGKTWMDTYWNPVSTDRIVYVDGKGNFVSKEELAKAGLTVNDSKGYAYSDFAEDLGNIDIETIAGASAVLLPPDAVERAEGESIENWVKRVYENTQYKNYIYNHNGGPNGYDPDFADNMLSGFDEREIESLEENGNNTQITVANFDKKPVNGIDVWFGENEQRGYSYKVLVKWIGEGNNTVSEYFYTEQEQFYLEHTEEAKTEINSVVEEVTPLGSGWELTVNHYPQAGRDDAYYFQMEAEGNVPEGKKTIYIPYCYLDVDLTYETAVAKGFVPKLHHYNKDHTQIELIEGKLTKYGMEFVVESFSPFVIAYDISEEEVEQKVVIDEKLETVPDSLKEKFDSVDEMKDALEKEIFEETEINESETGIKFMEITLQMKTPDGEWIVVTEENFPEEGVEVLIPYPAGTSAESHKFAVAHLISSGEKLGQIEILVPEETEDGLLVKVHSLSPFAVAYEEESNYGEDDETEEKPSVRPAKPAWGNGNKVTIIDGREEEKNPGTGAPVFEVSSAIALLSTAAVLCIRKKK